MTSLFNFYLHNIKVLRSKSAALKNIIIDNVGSKGKIATNGKVRIYVAHNYGSEKGYHLLASKDFESDIPRQRLEAKFQGYSFDANRFDLNLADPDIDRKIEYIIAWSLCYEKKSHMDSMFFMTRDKINNEMEYGSVEIPINLYKAFICAFDRHRFYKPSEILSDSTVREHRALAFTEVEEDAILNQKHVKEWMKFDFFIPTFYTDILGETPFIPWW